MQTQTKRRWIILSFTLTGVLLIALLTAMLASAGEANDSQAPAAPTAGIISGRVTNPEGGAPPAGARVKLWQPDGTLAGQALVDEASGQFTLGPAPNGNYVLRAVPPELSSLTPSLPRPIHVTGGPLNAGTLALTHPSLSGTVTAPDGLTPAAAWVGVYRADGVLVESDWAPAGEYRLGGVITGTYLIKAKPTADDPYWWSDPVPHTITPNMPQTLDLLLRPANVYGRVESPTGAPVMDAVAHVFRLDAPGHSRDDSNASGFFAIGDLADGIYLLQVEPPYWRSDLLPTRPVTFSVPPTQTDLGTLQLRSSPKVVHGAVLTNLGNPVAHAEVLAKKVNAIGEATTLTAADGSYQLRLSAGTWALTVRPVSGTLPAEWVYPLPPQLVHFAYDDEAEIKAVNFKVLTADSNVIGSVQLPGGGTPTFTVTVQLRNSEGVGAGQIISPDGSFDVALPHGAYQPYVLSADRQYAGPPLPAIQVPPSSTLDLGAITLIPRDALITGTVTDEDGAGVVGVRVSGWTRGHIYGEATTGPDGSYTMAVISGTWKVSASPSPALPYIFTGTSQLVTVVSGATAAEVDFQLATADATIVGQLVLEDGTPAMEAAGWASASAGGVAINGAPVEQGTFTIPVPAGNYAVGVTLAADTPYLAPSTPTAVSLGSGETAAIIVIVRPKDATILGALWAPRQGEVVSGVAARVAAWSDWAMQGTAVDPGNGGFRLDVSADLWHLGYLVDPAADFVQLTHRKYIPLQSGQIVQVGLPVAEKDSTIRGLVLDPAGDPYNRAIVVADGTGRGVEEVTLKTRVGADGRFQLQVPYGVYNLRAIGGTESGYLNPAIKRLVVPPNTVLPGLVLQFHEADAIISGTVTLDGLPAASGTALVWGWTPDGSYSKSHAELGDMYTLAAISNTTWHVGGVYETATAFWAGREEVILTGGNATQDLVLTGPHPKPAPVAVTWDAADPQFVALADGTAIFLPAGSLPVSGTVTLHIIPIAALPHQPHANIYKYGWAFEAVDSAGQPITSHFNQNVVVAFQYDKAELAQWGIEEKWIKPAYFSTSTNSWTFPDSYVVDTAGNRVIMQIDHFTDFALVVAGDMMHTVYLPAVLR